MENNFINIRQPKDILFITFLSYIQTKNEICLNHTTVKIEFYKIKITVKFGFLFFLDKETWPSLQKTAYLTLKNKILSALAPVWEFPTENRRRAILSKALHVVWIHLRVLQKMMRFPFLIYPMSKFYSFPSRGKTPALHQLFGILISILLGSVRCSALHGVFWSTKTEDNQVGGGGKGDFLTGKGVNWLSWASAQQQHQAQRQLWKAQHGLLGFISF